MNILDIGGNWATFAIFAINALIGWAIWSLKSRFASKDDHGRLIDRVRGLEEKYEQIPGLRAVHELKVQMTALYGELKSTNTRLDGFNDVAERMQRQLDLIDEFLRHQGARK